MFETITVSTVSELKEAINDLVRSAGKHPDTMYFDNPASGNCKLNLRLNQTVLSDESVVCDVEIWHANS